ncbi:MAG: hypothetical protein KJ622_14000 [Alphaproteobacteria bacterium]|nr:hypothetical protein [Alphaproteobacteria bacterium]
MAWESGVLSCVAWKRKSHALEPRRPARPANQKHPGDLRLPKPGDAVNLSVDCSNMEGGDLMSSENLVPAENIGLNGATLEQPLTLT